MALDLKEDNVCFVNRETREEFVMDPCDIVLSEALIEGFDSIQAFYLGVLAGVKMHQMEQGKARKVHEPSRRPYLWVVK